MRQKKSYKVGKIASVAILSSAMLILLAGMCEALETNDSSYIPVIICFKDKLGENTKINLIKEFGGKFKQSYHIIPAVSAKIPAKAIERLKKHPSVKYVEIDGKVYASKVYATAQSLPWGVDRIDAEKVHPYNKGTGIKIAVLDTGIDYTHPDLDDNYKGGYDFVNDDADPMDDNGHGTHVAGIIAAEDNGFGVVGVAPEAYIYAVKVLDSNGSGTVSDVIAGIEWAVDNNMQIVSMSLGTPTYSQSLRDACNAAYNAGLLLVAAAGNNGNLFGIGDNVVYPAKFDSVIAVAATDENDERASFSSTGPEVELAAPGVNINSTYLGGSYRLLSGTSMACPHVTGVAALVWKAYPYYNNTQVRERLQQTAEDLGDPGRDNWFGCGLVDAEAAAYVDSTPPVISNVQAVNITSTSATITWYTDELSNSTVRYGTTIPPTNVASNSTFTTNHVVVLTGLEKNTTYYYEVLSADPAGNVAVDNNGGSYYSFTTQPNVPPVASAGADVVVSDADNDTVEAVTLNASTSYDPDGSIVSYEWRENSTVIGNASVITHNFSIGTHTVTLVVTDDDGDTSYDVVNITVNPNQPPTANIQADKLTAYVGEPITFNASTSQDPDGEIVAYCWEFGDGTTGSGIVVTHTYSATGNYTVNLTVTDNGGASDTDSINVSVVELLPKKMHVKSIDILVEKRRAYMRAIAIVTITDENDNPVESATVMGHWSGLTTDEDAGNTNSNGKTILYSEWVRRGSGVFEFTVDNVVKSGWVYDSKANKETSDSVTVRR